MLKSSSQHTTLTTPGGASSRPARPGLSLAWLFPRPTDAAVSLDFASGEERLIGRDESCSVRLLDPSISRRHAGLRREGDELYLVDQGSRNGTRVNARRTQSARLEVGDIVRLGDVLAFVTDRPGLPTELGPGLLAGPLLAAELEPAKAAAASDLPVILEGETGTGKEVVARAIHAWSGRTGPFVAVNCAALPEGLAEGELFGYRRGAFTGADRASAGFFRSAERGTLLLDEVPDLPLVIQAKLLRVLEQREVQPLGEAKPVAVDVRVIVATQEPLARAVAQERFRPDLLARLDGISVQLPPLRKRPSDVLALFRRALSAQGAGRVPSIDADLVERLCLYDWPFNVREVVLLAKRLQVLCGSKPSLGLEDLPLRMRPEPEASELSSRVPAGSASRAQLDEGEPVELSRLMSALRACQGNVTQAAAALGISRQRAYRMMQGHDVDLEAVRREVKEP